MKCMSIRALAALLALILLMGVCGCTMNPNEIVPDVNKETQAPENKVVLTERQKKILADEGLPQEYSELTTRQQKSITDIEQMLQAVESKYGKTFLYINYTAEKELESGELTAYPENGNAAIDAFTVKREADNSFSDTYMCVLARPAFEEYLSAYAAETAGTDRIRVYSKVLETSLSQDSAMPEDFANKLTADSWIFVDGASVTEEAFASFTTNVTQWLQEQGLYGSAYFILLKEDHLMLLTKYNYTDYLTGDWVVARQFCNVMP